MMQVKEMASNWCVSNYADSKYEGLMLYMVLERKGDSYFSIANGIETESNARLIAASPDLLKVMQDILSAHDDAPNHPFSYRAALSAVFADRARAAIAKATGKEVA